MTLPPAVSVLKLGAVDLARLVREQTISASALMLEHLRRVRETHQLLNAAVEIWESRAMEEAARADERLTAGEAIGPLHGIPFSVKDSIDVQGCCTTAGTLGRKASPAATKDATLVQRLRSAGAIPICKTNLPDLLFAYETDNLIFGRSNNPYDLERTPGGSSGGESALIAACGSPLGLGSDAAGSVRVPAAFCGIAGIKPTSGCLPRTGHVPPAGGWIEALWQIGPMARRVEDLLLAMELLAGEDNLDFTCPPGSGRDARSLSGMRVAMFTDNGFAPCSHEVRTVVESAAGALRAAGLQVEEQIVPGVDQAYDLEMRLLGADGGDAIDRYFREVGSHQQHWLLHAGFLDRMRPLRCSMSEFGQLWARWDLYRIRMAEFFTRFDAVLCPVYPKPALLHGESATSEHFEGFSYTMAWNVSGNPAAVVRCGESAGLPVNVQVVTAKWQDARALHICAILEDRLGGWQPSRS